MSADYSNKLIFGKDQTERIVSLETNGDETIAFIQEKDGSISKVSDASVFWILTDQKVSSKMNRLAGDQHYKFIGTFPNQEERDRVVKILKKENVDFYRIFDGKEQTLVYNGMTYYKGLQPKEVSILSFDIEATTLLHNEHAKLLIISNTFRDSKGNITQKMFAFDEFQNECEMINAWCSWVRKMDPSIMCGHNIYGYDFGYLNYIARLNGTSLRLGRDGSDIKFDMWDASFRVDGTNDIEYRNARIFGREIVDTMFLSYKYDAQAKKFESYGLKSIIRTLGLEKQGRTFVDAAQIRNLYKDPKWWKLIKQYAEEDADDSLKLFDIMIPAYFYVAQSVSKPFQAVINSATGSQLNNVMVRSYLQDGHSIAKADEIKGIVGGISFAVPNIYKNLYKVDIKSCYPSQILRFKLYDKKKDPEAHFYQMVEYFTLKRFELKKLVKETGDAQAKDRDKSAKEFINSAYGVCTTPGLNYNCEEVGKKITTESRKIINNSLKWASGKNAYYWFEKFYQKTDDLDKWEEVKDKLKEEFGNETV